jgi:competence protein ComFC
MISPRKIPTFARAADALLDLIFPRECPVTGEPPDDTSPFRHLSPEALRRLPIVYPPCCDTCGAPFFGVLAGPQVCVHCRDLEPEFDSGRTVMLARDSGRVLIHELKYHGARHLAGDLARLATLAPGYLERLRGAVLVPVPLHPNKFRKRGFNQSLLIARELAKLAPGARVVELLDRVKDNGSQTRLDRDERRKNADGAFALRRGARVEPAFPHVVIDDVFTTGATLNACCETLRDSGITRLAVATLAHG